MFKLIILIIRISVSHKNNLHCYEYGIVINKMILEEIDYLSTEVRYSACNGNEAYPLLFTNI